VKQSRQTPPNCALHARRSAPGVGLTEHAYKNRGAIIVNESQGVRTVYVTRYPEFSQYPEWQGSEDDLQFVYNAVAWVAGGANAVTETPTAPSTVPGGSVGTRALDRVAATCLTAMCCTQALASRVDES
jgi:hypothetical protein